MGSRCSWLESCRKKCLTCFFAKWKLNQLLFHSLAPIFIFLESPLSCSWLFQEEWPLQLSPGWREGEGDPTAPCPGTRTSPHSAPLVLMSGSPRVGFCKMSANESFPLFLEILSNILCFVCTLRRREGVPAKDGAEAWNCCCSLEAGRLALKLDGLGRPSAKPTSVFLF